MKIDWITKRGASLVAGCLSLVAFVLCFFDFMWVAHYTSFIYDVYDKNNLSLFLFSVGLDDSLEIPCGIAYAITGALVVLIALHLIRALMIHNEKMKNKIGKISVGFAVFTAVVSVIYTILVLWWRSWSETNSRRITCGTGFYIFAVMIILIVLFSIISVKAERDIKVKQVMIINSPVSSNSDELIKFKTLLDSGAITQEEYDIKKKELLGFDK